MLILRNNDAVPEPVKGGVVAIGNFDGVHRGHKALISRACARAKEEDKPAGVIVFEPHPSEFFRPQEPHFRLTPLPEKLRLLETLGADFVVVLDFDADLAGMSANDFIESILVQRLAVSHVVIGYDFFFGRKRSGSPDTMRLAGKDAGFGTTVVAQQAEDGEIFSSTAIRLHLAQGDVAGAERLLGHRWSVTGTVIGGNRIGTGLGFPTANVALAQGTALMHGIYAVKVHLPDGTTGGAAYFGARPSVDGGEERLEVFIFDFEGDLYGRQITVEFVAFIRGDRRFETFDALKSQIAEDCQNARQILADAGASPLASGAAD